MSKLQSQHNVLGAWLVPLVAVAAMAVLLLGFSGGASAQESVFRVGGSVVVRADERVDDVVAIGGSVEVLGSVSGDVVAVGGSVTVDGTVTGDVVAVGGVVNLGPTARVRGDVTAVGGSVNRHPESVVDGEVSLVTVAESFRFGWFDFGWWPPMWSWMGLPLTLLYVAGLFALASLVLAWVPDRVHAVEEHMEANAGRSVMIGLMALLLLAPLTLVLIFTIIGAPLLWFGFFAAKMLGYVALVSIVGRKVTERFAPETGPAWQLVVGVVLVALLRYVPLFGGLFSLVATVWTVGAVLDTKFGTNRPWLPPRQA